MNPETLRDQKEDTMDLDINSINTLALEYKEQAALEKQAKELKGAIKDSILVLLGDTKSVTAGGFKVTQSKKEAAWRLNEKMLVEAGVSVVTISKCKKQDKESAPSLTITEVKA
jgi:hypothetical protein